MARKILDIITLAAYLPAMFIPTAVFMAMRGKRSALLAKDIDAAYDIAFPGCSGHGFYRFYRLMVRVKEFRNIFYFRTGIIASLAKLFLPPINSLKISKIAIGGGYFCGTRHLHLHQC